MRRTKKDMLFTREQVLNAAFDCFFEMGYERSSLEEIARRAKVTRGAIYWHYEGKSDLYRAVVEMVLVHGDVSKFADRLPADMSLVERLEEVFFKALDLNPYVDFVFRAINFAASHDDFTDVFSRLQAVKLDLFNYFTEEIKRFMALNRIQADPSVYSTGLFLLFEGLFLTKNIPIGIKIDRDLISHNIGILLDSLLYNGSLDKEASPVRED